jgi:DNA modification methylase
MHPTQKPVGLFERILADFSEAEAGILDVFLGSGTTLIACERTNRIGYGMEIDPAYIAVTLQRMKGMGIEPELIP